MKQTFFLLSILFLLFSLAKKSEATSSTSGTTVKAPDGLYEFTLSGGWKEFENPGEKIEKMYVTSDNSGRFFVLRIANPPHTDFKEDQLMAYVDGLKNRYKNLNVLDKKVRYRDGTYVGIVSFTYDENSSKGPLTIRNYCEVMIHKKTYLNFCGVAPSPAWETQREKILKIFPTLKLL